MSIVCINNGYYNTKVKTTNDEFMFQSKFRNAIDDYEQNVIKTSNGNFVVGEGNFDISLNKTENETQRLCIAHALERTKLKEFHVVSSMPVNQYLNKNARDDYLAMLFSFQGVASSKVYMEGMSAVLNDISYYKDKLICLLDIGGFTINSMLIEDGKLVHDTAYSMDLGTIILENRIKKALEQNELCTVKSYQIKYMMDNAKVRETILDYVDEIKQNLKQFQFPSYVQYRFTGGGAVTYKDILKDNFKNCYIKDEALWENVRGLYEFAKVVYTNEIDNNS